MPHALMESSQPHSSARKSRAKYAPRACLQCRRRKLKCSGQLPCPRCVRHGQQCSFGDDFPNVPTANGMTCSNDVRNTNDLLRSSSTQGLNSDGRADAAMPQATSSVESRLERLEAKLEALIASKNGESLRASVEPEQAEAEGQANDFQGDSTFQAPLNTFNANIESMRAQLGIPLQRSDHNTSSPTSHVLRDASIHSPSSSTSEATRTVNVGGRLFQFPRAPEYTAYLDFFFNDINPCHSCVNEADFRNKSEKMLSTSSIRRDDICFLALNYIIFACADILRDMTADKGRTRLPGWVWFLAADALVGRRKISGKGDLTLIQFLIYESFYLVHADKPNPACNVIGLACRLCFQYGLHQQNWWGPECSDYSIHMRQRIFWTVYFVDRRISLSCGRPYSIRDLDIRLDAPAMIYDRELTPGQSLPPSNHNESAIMYLHCMISFAKLAGEVWDQVFSAGAYDSKPEIVVILDARIQHWCDSVLPTLPLLPINGTPTALHLRHVSLTYTRMNYLRLLLRRRMMVSLQYDTSSGRICGDLAIDMVQRIKNHADEINQPSSFRMHMATSLGGAVLILATLLCRNLSEIGLQERQPEYAESFNEGVSLLRGLASCLYAARRVLDDLDNIVEVVSSIINRPGITFHEDIARFIPTDIDTLFPFGPVDFAHHGTTFDEPAGSVASHGGSGVFNFDTLAAADNWDVEFEPNMSSYGVSWI